MKILPLLLIVATTSMAADPIELKLWSEGPPGKMLPHSPATADFIRTKSGKSTITDIHDPTITVYRPEKSNGTSVIVAPGGGYVFLSAIHEGTQVCEWLNTLGITGILLKYRTPTRDETAPHEKPVQDAAKAIALVRSHAKEWNLDPTRVGLLGFSAGGNLLAHLACDRVLKTDLPNFGIMIYGGGWVDSKDPTKLKPGFTVPADAPPIFIACAHDDGQNPLAATALYLEYKKHNIPAELHLFTKGGHGFGMRDNKHPINQWPQRCAEWMESAGSFRTVQILKSEIEKIFRSMQRLMEGVEQRSLDLHRLSEKMRAVGSKLVGAQGNEKATALAETELRQLQQSLPALDKGMVPGVPRDTILEDLSQAKLRLAELQAELETFIHPQPKSKQP